MSVERDKRVAQLPLPHTEKEQLYIFPTGTYIYPEYGGRGRLENTIVARKLPYKIHKLTGYEVEVSPRLWDNKLEGVHSWTMHGLRFGAYSSKARAVLAK